MKLFRASWLLGTVAVASLHLAACATTTGKKDAAEDEPAPVELAPRLVGRISSIRTSPHFVLIQSYGSWDVPTGAVLTTRGEDGRTANLLATGERSGQFAAADVRAGEVEVGDAVFSLPPPPPAGPETRLATGLAEAESPPPEAPAEND